MFARCAAAILLLSAGLLAQSSPPACPAGRPVDELITEIHNQQSKMKARNKSPLPDVICIFGWCRERHKGSGSSPRPSPPVETTSNSQAGTSSSSKSPEEKCDEAMERALAAAHDVDVGDFYFGQKNYRAALFRYQDADQNKAGDSAIHVRLGRAFEKLDQVPQAIEQYQAAEKLSGPEKWTEEARSALARLQTSPAGSPQ